MNNLIDLIRDSVEPRPHPAILISGGLDSTILLHHLKEKTEKPIFTYTMGIAELNEFQQAEKVAKHYGTVHRNILVKDILPTLAKLQQFMDRPRWNLWPYWCYREAEIDGCQNAYIAEGMDEHFGGYWYKPEASYQEYWGGVLEWSLPTHRKLAGICGLNLLTPFIKLNIRETLPLWDGVLHDKTYLRELYKGILSDFVIERRKNPGRIDFLKIWDIEVQPHLKIEMPDNMARAYYLVNKWVTEKWSELHA